MEDELDMESQLERELLAEQEELLVGESENMEEARTHNVVDDNDIITSQWKNTSSPESSHGLSKVRSLPSNFIYNHGAIRKKGNDKILISCLSNNKLVLSCTSQDVFKYFD